MREGEIRGEVIAFSRQLRAVPVESREDMSDPDVERGAPAVVENDGRIYDFRAAALPGFGAASRDRQHGSAIGTGSLGLGSALLASAGGGDRGERLASQSGRQLTGGRSIAQHRSLPVAGGAVALLTGLTLANELTLPGRPVVALASVVVDA